MAENLRDVPAQYGDVIEGFHPRIQSYGRRILSVGPNLLLAAVLILFLFYKRPAAPYVAFALVLIVVSAVLCYSVLKPATAALTQTHVLHGRLIGWRAVERSRIRDTVFVERMRPKAALTAGNGPVSRLRYRGVPALWFLDERGKPLLRFDGRIWDTKSLKSLSGKVTPSTTYFDQANVMEIDAAHPGLVSFSERHPKVRPTVLTVLGLLTIAFIIALSLWPGLFRAVPLG